MTTVDDRAVRNLPVAADEAATLLGFLDYQRATLAWKCAGLDAAGLGAKTAASSMTLGGLLKHMAYVEDSWFSHSLHGQDRQAAVEHGGLEGHTRTGTGHSAAGDSAGRASRTLWQDAVDRSRLPRRGGAGRRRAGPLARRAVARRVRRRACAGSCAT